jgi:hypothetical protein
MPVVAAVADVIISAVIGDTIAATVTEVVGSALIGDVVSGAVVGAIGGATSAAIQGGNIWKGAEKGAEMGGISGGVQGVLQGAELTGTSQTGGPVNLSQLAGPQVGSALSKGLGTFVGSELTGGNLKSSLERGLVTGGLDYLFPSTGSTGDKITSGIEKGFASTALSQLLAPSSSARGLPSTGGVAVTGQPGQTGTAPGSQALAQALNVGDAGLPVLGGGDSTGRKNVWNVESLRYMGNPPSENTSG